ncbi:MAG: septum site-determining protein MinC, partial [Bradyrhizobium sp.]
ALVLVPEQPLADWLAGLDAQMKRSPAYFAGKPVVVDLATLAGTPHLVAGLMDALGSRGIRVVGIEGLEAGTAGADLPPVLSGGRTVTEGVIADAPAEPQAPPAAPPPEPAFLLLDAPVRSGQSVVFPRGDVTVVGSIGSGAEVVAGGSIHVYGTLRGRAMAGVNGNSAARIYCQKIEAELLAIDGYYQTAEQIDDTLRNRPAQAWLDGETMKITALN